MINYKNGYFYSDIINLDEFDISYRKADIKSLNDIDIYYLGYEHRNLFEDYRYERSIQKR